MGYINLNPSALEMCVHSMIESKDLWKWVLTELSPAVLLLFMSHRKVVGCDSQSCSFFMQRLCSMIYHPKDSQMYVCRQSCSAN